MKNLVRLFAIAFVLIFTISCVSVKKSNMEFVDITQLDEETQIAAVNVPTFMVKPFIVKTLKKDGESKEVINLVKSIKKVKVLTIDNPNPSVANSFNEYKKQHNIEELMVVNNDGNRISINANQNEKIINRLLLQVKSNENEVVYVDLKGKFTLDNLAKLINQ